MKNIKKNIVSRLSLRKPQEDSLDILSKILDKVNLRKDSDPNETLKTIKFVFHWQLVLAKPGLWVLLLVIFI